MNITFYIFWAIGIISTGYYLGSGCIYVIEWIKKINKVTSGNSVKYAKSNVWYTFEDGHRGKQYLNDAVESLSERIYDLEHNKKK